MIHAAAVALIHAHNIHSSDQAVSRDPKHVLRFARALKSVYDDESEGAGPLLLPVTVAEHGNTVFHFD